MSRVPLGRDARDLVRDLLKTMADGNPSLKTILEEAEKSDLWMESLWDCAEQKLIELHGKNRRNDSCFRKIGEYTLSRESLERERIHGDIDI